VRANPDVDLRLRVNRGRASDPIRDRSTVNRHPDAQTRLRSASRSRSFQEAKSSPTHKSGGGSVSFFLADRVESEILDARAEAPRRFALIARVVFARDTESDFFDSRLT